MLNVTESKSVSGAVNYFREALDRADYYITGEDVAGRWHGKLAHRVGLDDGEAVSSRRFGELAAGKDVTQRMKSDRRPGWDYTFSAPKGVSLVFGATGDERLVAAVQDAANETMRALEAEMAVRVRRDGANSDRVTGNMLWASFLHKTARPVMNEHGEITCDPQLHVHQYVINASWDDVESKFKAAETGAIRKDMSYWEAHYHSLLSSRLKAIDDEAMMSMKVSELLMEPVQKDDMEYLQGELGPMQREQQIDQDQSMERR